MLSLPRLLRNQSALLLAGVAVVALGLYAWHAWEPDIVVPGTARAPKVAPVQSVPGGPQTPEYGRLQRLADQGRAETARVTGGSSVPTPPELSPLAAGEAPPAPPPSAALPPRQPPPPATRSAVQPLGGERSTHELAAAMQKQIDELIKYRDAHFKPTQPTTLVAYEDIAGQRERGLAASSTEPFSAAQRVRVPHDGRAELKPGDILFAVLQTAINSDEPGPVRAKIVGERFKDAILLGQLSRFPPVVGNRPERVLVEFTYLTTPARVTYALEAYAIDLATARTALATGVDHHYLERWGSLVAASFLEGYGDAVRSRNRITRVGPLGNVVTLPKSGINHGDIVREAVGTVGERLADVVADGFQRPNTITVGTGTGIGILILAPSARERGAREDATAERTPARRPKPTAREIAPEVNALEAPPAAESPNNP